MTLPGSGPVSPEPAISQISMLLAHDRDIDDLKLWRAEVRGAISFAKFALGTSAVTNVIAVIALIVTVMLQRPA